MPTHIPLTLRMDGDEVAAFQHELSQLFEIPEEEIQAKRFGRGTYQAVKEFQRQAGIKPSGVADAETAAVLRSELALLERARRRFTVKGVVSDGGGSPALGLIVRAYDLGFRDRRLLTDTTTNAEGRFTLVFTAAQLTDRETEGPDLHVEVFTQTGELLAQTETPLFNASDLTELELEVPRGETGRLSVTEKLELRIRKVGGDTPLSGLSHDDLVLIAGETREHVDRLGVLVSAAMFATQTGLPKEAHFAWGVERMSRDALQAASPVELKEILVRAIDSNEIPNRLRARVDDIIAGVRLFIFETGGGAAAVIHGRVQRRDTGDLIGGGLVRVRPDSGAAGGLDGAAGHPVVETRVDADGEFSLTYQTWRIAEPLSLTIEALDESNAPVAAATVALGSETKRVEVELEIDGGLDPDGETIDQTVRALELAVSPQLQDILSREQVSTLAGIARLGGLSHLEGVDPEDAIARTLESHARLSILPGSARTRQRLIDAGFDNLHAIAESPRGTIVEALDGIEGGDIEAAALHTSAVAQRGFLDGVLAGLRMGAGNTIPYSGQAPVPETAPQPGTLAPPPYAFRRCDCEDCEAAVSPLAYLADLMSYVTHHVKSGASYVTLNWLKNAFDQPFGDLPVECEQVNEQVRQVRICIEVLRRGMPTLSVAAAQRLAQAEAQYLERLYRDLLDRLGGDFEMLRLARSGDEDERASLSDRLGVEMDTGKLERLFIDTTDPAELNELQIERLFGLADTRRDPLSQGAVADEAGGELTRWRLDGIAWGRNTSADGAIYVGIHKQGTAFHVELFKDAQRQVLVAKGTRTGSGAVRLYAHNHSDLSGEVTISMQGTSAEMVICAIPELLAWRLQHLRTLWFTGDWPEDGFAPSQKAVTPIVDPDVIGVDDFRNPQPGMPAYDLWLQRRPWVDAQLAAVRSARENQGVAAALELALGTPAPDLEALAAQLDGDDTEAGLSALEDLGIPPEAFALIVDLTRRDANTTGFAQPPTEGEWDQFCSILVQAMKRSQFTAWITAENQLGVALHPDTFWKSLTDPRQGTWPPVAPPNTPRIDPEDVSIRDLPDSEAGDLARSLHADRSKQLQQLRADLKAVQAGGTFDDVLAHALGDPNPGDALPVDIEQLYADLRSGDPATVDAATTSVTTSLFMSVESFSALMRVRQKESTPGSLEVSAQEWDEVLAILVSASKRKRLYPGWLAVESQNNLDSEYWRARKAALPEWRASAGDRSLWHAALGRRSRTPHLEPDLVDAEDIHVPVLASPPYAVLSGRRTWMDTQLTSLAATPQDLGGFDAAVNARLGIAGTELTGMSEAEADGDDLSRRFAQLALTRTAFERLARVRRLLVNGAPVVPSEWTDAWTILATVMKQLSYGDWNAEERAAGYVLGPDVFRRRATKAPPFQPGPWRIPNGARREWEDTLDARLDQVASTQTALASALDSSEGARIDELRDALIQAWLPGSKPLETKAGELSATLLIDMKMSACSRTTRVAQGIETLQTLLFRLRLGHLDDTYPNVTLHDESFDEKWRWIGSYATWRAAMFVFIYPENVLIPSLRPIAMQSPGFKRHVEALRNPNNQTPGAVCAASSDYAAYYRDVCQLEIKASVIAMTRIKDHACGRPYADYGDRDLVHLFGLTRDNHHVYFSTYDPNDSTSRALAFWARVPSLEEVEVREIVGATPYERDNDRHIYLFVSLRRDPRKIYFTRFNLVAGEWDGSLEELEGPESDLGEQILDVRLIQRRRADLPPTVLFRIATSPYLPRIFVRSLLPDGSAWQGEDVEESNGEEEEDTSSWEVYRLAVGVEMTQLYEVYHAAGIGQYTTQALVLCYRNAHNPLGEQLVVRTTEWKYIYQTNTGTQGNPPVPHHQWKFPGWWLGSSLHYGKLQVLYNSGGSKFNLLNLADPTTNGPSYNFVPNIIPKGVVRQYGPPETGQTKVFIFAQEGDSAGWFRWSFKPGTGGPLEYLSHKRLLPAVVEVKNGGDSLAFDITDELTTSQLQVKRVLVKSWFDKNVPSKAEDTVIEYLKEAYHYVPLQNATQLEAGGFFVDALDWYRTVLDYTQDGAKRRISPVLQWDAQWQPGQGFDRPSNWLLDPLNPHGVAETRHNAHNCFVLMWIARCLLSAGHNCFTTDTAESLARARLFYEAALELLDSEVFAPKFGYCDGLLGELEIELGTGGGSGLAFEAVGHALGYLNPMQMQQLSGDLSRTFSTAPTRQEALETGLQQIAAAREQRTLTQTIGGAVDAQPLAERDLDWVVLSRPGARTGMQRAGTAAAADFLRAVDLATGSQAMRGSLSLRITDAREIGPAQQIVDNLKVVGTFTPIAPHFEFCIPPNPMLKALRLEAEVSLFKLRNCLNIAGMRRDVDPYAAPVDAQTGLPYIGAGGQLVLPGVVQFNPTQYRYQAIIERAKQLVALAQQVEAGFLSALEKFDAEQYGVLRARQDVELARAGVRLQDLRVREAESQVELARRQQRRAEIELNEYEFWLQQGMSGLESASIQYKAAAASLTFLAAAAVTPQLTDPKLDVILSHMSGGFSGLAAIFSDLAAFERRRQQWELSRKLAQQDVLIGEQQVKIARDHVRVVGQERVVAALQADHSGATVEFLANKFTNAELYDWMSRELEGVYRYFLTQATAMARVATFQLAFDRQETPPPFIQADYWDTPKPGLAIAEDAEGVDRRGLTGSARLLRDIYKLDQYAFDTNRRKLQLSKTISLAQLAPIEFQRFRETGVIHFETTNEEFDREFPGHYLRLIRTVRMNVIALIPPSQGIRAALATTGLSRTVIEAHGTFQEVPIRRLPERVAFTSPVNTDRTELTPADPSLLLPFEGTGVATTWEVVMPRASNPFRFESIADVLVTIDYSALDSDTYRRQLTREMDTSVLAERAWSFRHQFADAWYDLHNPEASSTPMSVRFETRAGEFPANAEDPSIRDVALYFSRANGADIEMPIEALELESDDAPGGVGGSAITIDGLASTRRGNATSWMAMSGKSPAGSWRLRLPNTAKVRGWLKEQRIEDILLVVTYQARRPAFPV